MRKPWIWLMAAFALMGLGVWISPFTVTSNRTMARIQREGVIRIGYAVEPPYVFLDAEGNPTGCEIEVARKLAARLGMSRIEWCQTDFGSLISELEAGRFDLIAAGMFITPERARRVSFSEPSLHVRAALLVRSGNPHCLHSYEDVLRAAPQPIKIAVLHGSIEESMIRQAGVPEAQIIVVPDALTGKAALVNGLVDGLALSAPTIRFMARQEKEGLTEMVSTFEAPTRMGGRLMGYTANVFRKTDEDLQTAWNRQLQAFIGTPEHLQLIAEFGFGNEDLPGEIKTTEILASGAP
jgi:polar amino acid transport system substrate-binding protein